MPRLTRVGVFGWFFLEKIAFYKGCFLKVGRKEGMTSIDQAPQRLSMLVLFFG